MARSALLMLAAISLYRLPDFVMGPMANPLYHDIGLIKDLVGAVRGIDRLDRLASWASRPAALPRCALAMMRALIAGGVLQAVSHRGLCRAAPRHDPASGCSAAIMAFDNFSIELRRRRTCGLHVEPDQPGLYRDAICAFCPRPMPGPAKSSKAFPAPIVESLSAHFGLMNAYALFFVGAGAIGIPALILFALLIRDHNRKMAASSG